MAKEHAAFADHIGYARYVDAVRNGRAHVGHLAGDDAVWSYIRGCRLEMAFYLWLGGKAAGVLWNAFFLNATLEQLSLPDIICRGRPIDVKLRPAGWKYFIVRKQSLKAEVDYVLASDDCYPRCVFHGSIAGVAVAKCRVGGRPEVPGHVVEIGNHDIGDCLNLKRAEYRIPWIDPKHAAGTRR